MTYGFGTERSAVEEAFDLVERELRRRGVTRIELEYSEGVEVSGPRGSGRGTNLFASVAKVCR